jgi:protein TonB
VYAYEFDAFGNWTKMTTSVAVIEGGKISFEPTEATYRTISYYLDEATLAKMSQVATPSATTSTQSAPGAPTAAANKPAVAPPLPSGGSLVKTNVAASGAMNMSGSTGSDRAVVKLADEPPPPAAVTRAPKPLLKPVSGGVLNGRAILLPKPVYPQVAKSSRATGLVVVEVVIDETGKVISAKAVDGPQMLRMAAVQAAQGARFSPTMLSGLPVKVTGQINYNFAIQQ